MDVKGKGVVKIMDTVPYPAIPLSTKLKFQLMGWTLLSHLLLSRPILRRFMRKYLVDKGNPL